jgi:hypothetical protein
VSIFSAWSALEAKSRNAALMLGTLNNRSRPFGGRFKPTVCCCPLGRKFGFDLRGWNQVANIGRVKADLHLATQPDVVLGRFLLLLDEVPHEVPQQLGACAIAGFRWRGLAKSDSLINGRL